MFTLPSPSPLALPLSDFIQSFHAMWITETLSFYWFLNVCDKSDATGIRAARERLEAEWVRPVTSALAGWRSEFARIKVEGNCEGIQEVEFALDRLTDVLDRVADL
jgi:hypothetical protein